MVVEKDVFVATSVSDNSRFSGSFDTADTPVSFLESEVVLYRSWLGDSGCDPEVSKLAVP